MVTEITGINPSETLFIDDLEKNIRAAEEAGYKTFWLNNSDLNDLLL
jgi:putative hydrolase of the HAD superfamily